jgi:hypothetical protein
LLNGEKGFQIMYQFINSIAVKSVKLAGLALVVAASAGLAHAQTASGGSSGGAAPEIDPGSMLSALTLLTGGVLMITDKFRR